MIRLFLIIAFCLLSRPAFTIEIEESNNNMCWGYCFMTYGFVVLQPPEYQEFTCKDMFVFVHRKVKSNKLYSQEELKVLVTDECEKYNSGDEPYRYAACMDGGEQAISCFAKTGEGSLQRLSSECKQLESPTP